MNSDVWRLNHNRQIMCIFKILYCDILVYQSRENKGYLTSLKLKKKKKKKSERKRKRKHVILWGTWQWINLEERSLSVSFQKNYTDQLIPSHSVVLSQSVRPRQLNWITGWETAKVKSIHKVQKSIRKYHVNDPAFTKTQAFRFVFVNFRAINYSNWWEELTRVSCYFHRRLYIIFWKRSRWAWQCRSPIDPWFHWFPLFFSFLFFFFVSGKAKGLGGAVAVRRSLSE